MTCNEFEILLADSLDGNLHTSHRQAFDEHQATCTSCAGQARDAAEAMAFLSRAVEVIPPPAMTQRILAVTRDARRSPRRRFERWLGALWQPQFAMGLAMTLLSLFLASRFWPAASGGLQLAWERTIRGYENMQVVDAVQSQLQEWANDRLSGPQGENQ